MFGEEAIAQQLADARAQLASVARTPEANQVEPVTVEGAEGFLKVTIGVDGRVAGFEVDPRAMRVGSEVLFAEIKRMVNAGLDERAAAMGADEVPPDVDAINESVAAIQDRSLRQFQAMSASVSEVLAKLHGGR
ncbi:YbaB/EbfC family DNA-binding protein [Glycomyces paridis]|uniref:YbaB/EbfC family DNA-binding protein n=1 Tax=Glycomyces paridis TaxID=2126555 RepID=A0A4S8PJ95_9ACTN|nr:YbaB/EbfC family DNA-binding protein [Glycomyces paridis]THV29552.1 YbaB/EbfC family DNA-binding protein [Glycomyces paridis]